MTILVHIISISILMFALDGFWEQTTASRARGGFIDKAFRLATDTKIDHQSKREFGFNSSLDKSEQIIFDPKTKAKFKSKLLGDFFRRGKK